jgi:cellulose synthase/poly-beta-1,6-N-acetylglucosamine synthase-like glycosyltransferase
MARPSVTALIDTYNQEAFIEKAIDSVLQQDFPAEETEILVVDDGSTDRTPELVRKFAPRVRLLRKQNGGQASAFNAGIPEARGEIVAFLDGDDWWATEKLSSVARVFAAEPAVGLVGHGTTQVYPDGRQQAELPRELTRFRLTSKEQARIFRMRRGFLGTSRMAYRRELLNRMGSVPEALKFEADEYLFTLAGLYADVIILPKSYTFYRLHGGNLFQFTNGNPDSLRRKQQILATLAQALQAKLQEQKVCEDIANTILESLRLEAEGLRLIVDSGFPWETVSTELRIMRVFHSDASIWQHLFSLARLAPACVLPAAAYYRWRHRLSGSALYRKFRRRFFPFPVPSHVERQEKT